MLATAAFAGREIGAFVQLEQQGRVAAGTVEAGQAACFAGNECGAFVCFHRPLAIPQASSKLTRYPARTQVNACVQRGMAGTVGFRIAA